MKQMTLTEALMLRNFILIKTDRIQHLEREISKIRAKYKEMNQSQLEEALRDVTDMHKEIEQHKAYCRDAQKKVNAYFSCPIVELAFA